MDSPPCCDRLRILVVDDDRFGRAYPGWMLAHRFEVDVVEAENALQAMEILRQTPVDAVVTDLAMPGLDGLEMLEFIRSDPRLCRLEIVVASAYCYEQSVRRAIQLGVSDFIAKPFQPADMEKKFSALLRRVAKKRRARSDLDGPIERLRVLVAEADRNFCSFAAASLSPRYLIRCAASALEVLVLAKNWTPDLLLISPRLPGLEWQSLLDHVSGLGLSREMQIYLLDDDQVPGPRPDRRVAGRLCRAFIPETFLHDVMSILEPSQVTRRGAARWLASLEPEILSAVRQVFGVMTEIEPVAVDGDAPACNNLHCRLNLASPSSNLHLVLELRYSRDLALQLAHRLTGLEEDLLDRELLESAVAEIINVVAGRIRECCRARDLPLTVDLPSHQPAPAQPSDASIFCWGQCFRWADQEPFLLTLTGFGGSSCS